MTRPVVHLICNAHLDPVWQWRWEEGCSEALSTFHTAVEMLREHPRLIFNHNEAVLYQWVLDHDPRLFREIQRLVRTGRWTIGGGWYLQPDVNLPGTESLIRHIAVGRQFFLRHFNAAPIVAYNFDSFGHSGGLPQLLARAGYKLYIHMRPQKTELQLPSDLYRWKGIDGSVIPAYRIAVGLYHTERGNIVERLEEGTALALQLNRDVPVFWGIGNHGGGATRDDLRLIDEYIGREKRVRIIHSTTENLYASLKKYIPSAPMVEGDLQRVFTGCYTSLSRLKRRSVKSLGEIVQTEAIAAAAWWAGKGNYPTSQLAEIWKDHLFNDFHDILPGTCSKPAAQDALDQYGRASESARRLRLQGVNRWNLGRIKKFYVPVTVFNTNPGCTLVPVEAECMVDLRPKWTGLWHLRVYDLQGNEIPSQQEQPESLLPFNGWRRKVAFMAHLPAVGLERYEIRIEEGEKEDTPAPPMLRHVFDDGAGLVTGIDAGDGRECLAGGMLKALVVSDDGDSWGSDKWNYRNVTGVFSHARERCVTLKHGPVRTIRESVFTHDRSTIVLTTIAYPDWNVLEFHLRIHWNEQRKMLKLSIPTVFKANHILCEVPGGTIERPADGEEHVQGRWCMIGGALKGQYTSLAIVNNGQHGVDVKDGEIRLSVLRSPAYCHEQGFAIAQSPARKFTDQGVHEVRLLVTAGNTNDVLSSVTGLADWLSAPPATYAHLPIGNTDPYEAISLSPSNIRMTAMKQSWDGAALIIRAQEMSGVRTASVVRCAQPTVSKKFVFDPFEIKTFRIERSGTIAECAMVTED